MKRIIAGLLVVWLCLGLSACGKNKENVEANKESVNDQPIATTTEPIEVITGKKYICTKVQVTDEDYDEFDIADSVYNKIFNSTVVISEDRTVLVYTNQMGEYIADLETNRDSDMWYESKVSWRITPMPYGEHRVTATSLIFDEARGLVRMNFALNGKEGNMYTGSFFIFNEFELE